MYEVTETLLSHIEGLDALTANADEQAFETLGQGVGENTLDDTSKTETAGWIQTHMAGFIATLGAGVLLIGLVIIFAIWAKRKLNRFDANAANYDSEMAYKLNASDKNIINKFYTLKNILSEFTEKFNSIQARLNWCLRGLECSAKQENSTIRLSNLLAELEERMVKIDHSVGELGLKDSLNYLKREVSEYFETKQSQPDFVKIQPQLSDFDFGKPKLKHKEQNAFEAIKSAIDQIEKTLAENVKKLKPSTVKLLWAKDWTAQVCKTDDVTNFESDSLAKDLNADLWETDILANFELPIDEDEESSFL